MVTVQQKSLICAMAVAFVGYFVVTSSALSIENDHRRNILPGSRAAGLGGAYTALSDDPSGSYYNPAGLIFGSHREVSLNVNSRQINKITYRDIEALNNQDFTETSESLLPSFVGSNYRWSKVSVGWSYITIDSKNINQVDTFENLQDSGGPLSSFHRTHQASNTLFLTGASLSFKLTSALSIGVSQFYFRRSIASMDHQLVRSATDGLLVLDQKLISTQEGLKTAVGLMLRHEHTSIGFTARKANTRSHRRALQGNSVSHDGNPDNIPIVFTSTTKSNEKIHELPTTFALGLAWFPSKWLLFSGDVLYHDAVEHPADYSSYDLQPALNHSLGVELKLHPFVLRGGQFSNVSQHQKPKVDFTNQAPHIDYVGQSLGLSVIDGQWEGGFTIVRQKGSGTAQKIGNDPDIQNVDGEIYTFQLNANYALK